MFRAIAISCIFQAVTGKRKLFLQKFRHNFTFLLDQSLSEPRVRNCNVIYLLESQPFYQSRFLEVFVGGIISIYVQYCDIRGDAWCRSRRKLRSHCRRLIVNSLSFRWFRIDIFISHYRSSFLCDISFWSLCSEQTELNGEWSKCGCFLLSTFMGIVTVANSTWVEFRFLIIKYLFMW